MSNQLEHYPVLYPDGRWEWICTERDKMLAAFCLAIGCDMLESVSLPWGICGVVDESGKVKANPQQINPYASRLYPGTLYGDPLVGPVVFCRIALVDEEYDWVPPTVQQLITLGVVTGIPVPNDPILPY